MANSFNIQERTKAQVADSTDSINVVDLTGGVTASPRKSAYQPIVVRITDHADDTGVNCTTEELLDANAAIFVSARVGEPWMKVGSVLQRIIHRGVGVVDANASCIFPDFDYSTFE